MNDIRALAESFVKEEISHFGGTVPVRSKGIRLRETQVTKLMRDRAELARAVLRLLEAGEVLEKASIDDIHPHYDAHQAVSEAIDAWRAAVRGEEGG